MIEKVINDFYKYNATQRLVEFYQILHNEIKQENNYENVKKLMALESAIIYVLVKEFNCTNDDVLNEYKYISDIDAKEYIDNLKGEVNQKEFLAYHIDEVNEYKMSLSKGDTVYCLENGCVYLWDGKNFKNMC